jgi:hypothetical protein
MKRFDLQIGDVVNYKGIPVKIIGIISACVNAVDDNNREHILSFLDSEPIPLNDELLEELGFKSYDKDAWVYLGGTFGIRIRKVYSEKEHYIGYNVEMYCDHEDFSCTDNWLDGVRYVHTLQQFIRLCWVGEHPEDGKYLTGNKYKGE